MNTLIIPSAILVPRDMRVKFGNLPTALYPLNDMTMLEHICNKYKNHVDKIIVVGYENNILVEDYIHWKKLPVELVICDKLEDLGYTVYTGLKYALKDNPDKVYINFADTLLGDDFEEGMDDYIYYSVENYSKEFTFYIENNGVISDVFDKKSDKIFNGDKGKLFVGSFAFADVRLFTQYLTDSVIERKNGIDSFYVAIQKYSQDKSVRYIESKQWFDVGHTENYYKAKTGVEARSFNSIEIDESRGILKKRSANVEKFLGEINWYVKMPRKLQYLLPRVYDYSMDRENPYIEMEYYGYHTLHELLILGDLPLLKWQEIFRKLLFVVNDMQKFTVQGDEDDIKGSLKDIYITKTVERLNQLRENDNFKDFFNNDITINGKAYKNLDYYIDLFVKLAQKMLIDEYDAKFTIIHGDLCFANVLIEENYNFMRVIDPRGKFGGYDIYGDPRYELAKIMHTLEGRYDYIIEDMFTIEREGTSLQYEVPEKTKELLTVFLDVFKEKMGNINEVRLIEASLFLSMIPLHSDHLERQYAMLATGLDLLSKVVEAQ